MEELTAKITLKHQPLASFKKNLFRTEVIQQFIYIIKRSLCCKKFTGRYVEKATPQEALPK